MSPYNDDATFVDSSIVYWGYQDNFKPVYFFLTKRFGAHKNTPHVRRLCAREKLLPLLFSVSLFLFC